MTRVHPPLRVRPSGSVGPALAGVPNRTGRPAGRPQLYASRPPTRTRGFWRRADHGASARPRRPAPAALGRLLGDGLRRRASSACVAPARSGHPRCRSARRWTARTPGTPRGRRTTGRPSWPPGSNRPSRGRTPPGRSARTVRAPANPAHRLFFDVHQLVHGCALLDPHVRVGAHDFAGRGVTNVALSPRLQVRCDPPSATGRITLVKLHARQCPHVKCQTDIEAASSPVDGAVGDTGSGRRDRRAVAGSPGPGAAIRRAGPASPSLTPGHRRPRHRPCARPPRRPVGLPGRFEYRVGRRLDGAARRGRRQAMRGTASAQPRRAAPGPAPPGCRRATKPSSGAVRSSTVSSVSRPSGPAPAGSRTPAASATRTEEATTTAPASVRARAGRTGSTRTQPRPGRARWPAAGSVAR